MQTSSSFATLAEKMPKAGSIKNIERDLPGELGESCRVYYFPTIETKNSRGKTQYWSLYVRAFKAAKLKAIEAKNYAEANFIKIRRSWIKFGADLPDDVYAVIITDYRLGENGEPASYKPAIYKAGKNIGKKNQTNAVTQALLDAYSKYRKRITSAAASEAASQGKEEAEPGKSAESAQKLYPPMAGKRFESYNKEIDFSKEVYVQPKYDGVRLVATPIWHKADSASSGQIGQGTQDMEIILYSRFCRLYKRMYHLRDELSKFFRAIFQAIVGQAMLAQQAEPPQIYLDGEFYTHGKRLQDISGVSRRELEPKSEKDEPEKIDYYVFDMFMPNRLDMTFPERKAMLDTWFSQNKWLKYTRQAPSVRVKSMADVEAKYKDFLAQKFEGLILRLPLPYKLSYNNYRSDGIIKMKPEYDSEFTVVGYTTGQKGKAIGLLIFIFKTDDGKEFKATIKNISEDESRDLYNRMEEVQGNGQTYFEKHFLGRKLTVAYQDVSKDGKPVRAHVINLVPREYE